MNSGIQSTELINELQQLLEKEKVCRKNQDRIVAAMEEKVAMLQAILSPCSTCSNREKCIEPCELLRRQLPGKYSGKIHGEGTLGHSIDTVKNKTDFCDDLEEKNSGKLDQGKLKDLEKVISIDLFSKYEACWWIFTGKQQEVLRHYYRDGKTLTQIAKELHKVPSTIWGRLFRANKRKQKYYRKQS